MPLTVAFVAEGDASTANCWSGSGRRFVEALRAAGARVDTYDVELRSWPRAVTAALTYHPDRRRWRQRYGLGAVPFQARSALADRVVRGAGVAYDAVIQIGATFVVGKGALGGAPYVVYSDSNIAHALRGAPYSGASELRPRERDAVMRREQRVYDAVDRIWTMSDALARSYRDDFGQPDSKLLTIYAGANNPPTPRREPGGPPRILFVGKDHARKGSALLLAALDRVRREIPDAELHMVGGVPDDASRPGVVAHGVLSRDVPEQRATLDRLWGSSSVFCLPSRYEPFGIVFVEAMLAGLACVGTRSWAMPEIIVDGETGWLVPDGSPDELARALVTALRDPERCRRMGERGRARSLELFTWERVAARAIADLERMRSSAPSRAVAAR